MNEDDIGRHEYLADMIFCQCKAEVSFHKRTPAFSVRDLSSHYAGSTI